MIKKQHQKLEKIILIILNKQIGIFENNNYDFDVNNEGNWGSKTL